MATTRRRTLARAFRTNRNGRQTEPGPVHGTARLGRRTKDLVKRLDSGDVAVIDHRNLDRIAAEELIASGVRAVINVSPSSDGSYPNAGPLTLVRAGVPLVDVQDRVLFDRLKDGDPLVLDGGRVRVAGEVVAEGRLLEADELAQRAGRAAPPHRQGAARLHREHDGPHPRGGRAALGHDRLPRDAHGLPRPPRADRGAGDRPHQGPARAARLHPRRAARAGRGGRRRRRDRQGGPAARPRAGRHGLGPRGDAADRAPS